VIFFLQKRKTRLKEKRGLSTLKYVAFFGEAFFSKERFLWLRRQIFLSDRKKSQMPLGI